MISFMDIVNIALKLVRLIMRIVKVYYGFRIYHATLFRPLCFLLMDCALLRLGAVGQSPPKQKKKKIDLFRSNSLY